MPQADSKPPGIFICYRRDDSSGHALHLCHYLRDRLAGAKIFLDTIGIEPGAQFAQKIEREVGSCEIFIPLIGKRWLTMQGQAGRRLDDPEDFVRLEIATALTRDIRDITVIPVLVDGAPIPDPEHLPKNIAGLPDRQHHELSNHRWEYDADRLVTILKKDLVARKETRRRAEVLERERQKAEEAERKRREAEESARRRAVEAESKAAALAARAALRPDEAIILLSGFMMLIMMLVVIVVAAAHLLMPGGAASDFEDGPPAPVAAFIQRIDQNTELHMMAIPGRKFGMGTPANEVPSAPGQQDLPVRRVRVASFYIGMVEVTQEQWRAVMGKDNNPSKFKGDSLPVENVSLYEAQEFCRRLSEMSKRKYRLPTEAEWEYAARGGRDTPFAFGPSLSSDKANFNGNDPYGGASKGAYLGRTVPVGSYDPNKFGLYDMHGNVWEWCDGYARDGAGVQYNSSSKVLRGGAWDSPATSLRSGHRIRLGPTSTNDGIHGFRVVADAH